MSVTGSIMAGVGLAGSIGGAAIGANAAGNAASDQSQAAEQAAQLQYQASQNALGFQEQQYGQNQQNLQPWLQSGTGALSNLDYLMGISPQTSQQFQSGGVSMAPTGQPMLPNPNGGSPAPTGSPLGGPRPVAQTAGGPAAGVGAAAGTLGGATMSPQLGYQAPTATPQPVMNSPFMPGGAPSLTGGPTANPVSGAIPFSGGPVSMTPNPTGSPALPQGGAGYPAPVAGGGAAPGVGSINGAGALGSVSAGAPNPTGSPAMPPPAGGSASGGYGSLMQAYPGGPFTAPTAQEAMQSPGTQEALQLGNQSLQQSAAARGSLLTGGTAQALDTFGQQLGSQNYQNAYNNAYNTYGTNYNAYQQNQANQFNRLAAISGIGQTTAGQLGQMGQAASNNVSSNLLNTAQQIGQQGNNAAAANASGIIGSANAYGGAIGSAGSSINNLLLLQQLQGMGGTNPSSLYPADGGSLG